MITYTKVVDYKTMERQTVTLGVGTTLYTKTQSERVMSDIWEYITSAYYWNPETGSVCSHWLGDEVTATVDAEFKTFADEMRKAFYARHFASRMSQAEEIAARPAVHGRIVKVTRGKDKSVVGKIGKVVVVKEMSYGMGWQSRILPKLGIALDDEMSTYVARNGKTYPCHKNMIWVWAHNCEAVAAEVDMAEVERLAASDTEADVERVRRECLASEHLRSVRREAVAA